MGSDFGAQEHGKSSSKWINHRMRKRKDVFGWVPWWVADDAEAVGTFFKAEIA